MICGALDKEITEKWRNILTDLRNATTTTVSQCYFLTEGDNLTTHPSSFPNQTTELMVALITTRLGKFIIDSLSNHYKFSVHLWSDSQVVLNWIHSEKKLKQFVAHRVQEISQAFPTLLWCYCPTGDNPADILTRGTSSTALSASFWTYGPAWLTDDSKWPQWTPSATVLHLQADLMENETFTTTDPTEPSPDN